MKNELRTPILIIFTAMFIAALIVFSSGRADISGAHRADVAQAKVFGNSNSEIAKNVRPVDETDYVFGDRDAEVVIIEYSDFECPFCSRLHPTLKQIVEEHNGSVAWVYRQFPLTSIHSRAQRASVAALCVGELGGNESFWEFTDFLFKNQRSLGDELYREGVATLDIDETAFLSCIESNKHNEQVALDTANAVASGGKGTPFTIILDGKGNPFPFAGALPYEQIRSLVEQALGN